MIQPLTSYSTFPDYVHAQAVTPLPSGLEQAIHHEVLRKMFGNSDPNHTYDFSSSTNFKHVHKNGKILINEIHIHHHYGTEDINQRKEESNVKKTDSSVRRVIARVRSFFKGKASHENSQVIEGQKCDEAPQADASTLRKKLKETSHKIALFALGIFVGGVIVAGTIIKASEILATVAMISAIVAVVKYSNTIVNDFTYFTQTIRTIIEVVQEIWDELNERPSAAL